MIVNADELKLFRTIYETESLSEAAARLQLSLSKASRQLASLRKTFGDKLFVRCDHRMCPTLRARSLLPKVDALLSGFEALEDPGVFSVEQLRHVFRIAGLDNALLSYFGPVLGALGRHAPGVRLNFHSISSNFYAELHQGRIDLAIYATQESFPTFRRLAICEDAYVYVARGTSELARRVLSGQVLTEREVRARQSVQIALPKASADDCGLIPVIESLDASGQASPVLSAPYFVTVPLLLGAEATTCIPFQTAHALCRTTDLCILGRTKKSSVFTPSFIWSDRVDRDLAHQWLRSFLFSEMRQHLGDLRAVPILRN